MTRVVQSAGRVIRSNADRGVIILMDSRFLSESYVNSMPKDWIVGGRAGLQSQQILTDLKNFWDQNESL
jgi:DNA excision repair protein ERCC-2